MTYVYRWGEDDDRRLPLANKIRLGFTDDYRFNLWVFLFLILISIFIFLFFLCEKKIS